MIVAFIAGVVMTMLGLALLINGKAKLGSRKIKKAWAWRLGVFLLAFFPVILIERFFLNRYDPEEEEIDRIVVHGCVTGFWVFAALVMLKFAARKPTRPRPDTTAVAEGAEMIDPTAPFEQPAESELGFGAPLPTPEAAPPAKKRKGPAPQNPFDFQ